MQRVFNFSGGKTSAYMLIKYYKEGDIVLFCDTGREHPKTYKFINDFEAFENIPVIRLAYDGGFENMLYKWNKGKNIPNRTQRQCTIELKIKTARRYLRKQKLMAYENFIGFRADETRRVKRHKENWKKVATKFPLYDDGITKEDVINFWNNKSYNLEIPSILGNCDLCFMKGSDAIIAILTHYPELADKWIKDEDEAAKTFGHRYIKKYSMREMLEISKAVTKVYDLNGIKPAWDCACTA